MKTALDMTFFGSFQASFNNKPLSGFELVRVRALLVYLATEATQPHERSVLASLLWPEMPEKSALRNLTQTLVRLRRAIRANEVEPSFVLATRYYVQFNQDSPYVLDVTEFERVVETNISDETLLQPDQGETIEQLEKAIALYKGEFLPGFSLADSEALEEWILWKRERYHQLALNTLSTLATYYIQDGAYERAQAHAQRQLELDPWQERAYRQLMRALAEGGQRTAALAQYEKCREVLWEELGVEPEESTSILHAQIRSGEISGATQVPQWVPPPAPNNNRLHPAHSTVAVPSPNPQVSPAEIKRSFTHNIPHQLTTLIGRTAQMAEIGETVAKSSSPLITLVGPGGVGKTRLALAVAERIVMRHTARSTSSDESWMDSLTDGVWYVPLAGIEEQKTVSNAVAPDKSLAGKSVARNGISSDLSTTSPYPQKPGMANSRVAQAIIDALGVPLSGGQAPQAQLVTYVRDKEMLLILDNFEHMMAEIDLVLALMREAPLLHLLITSRETLNISGEYVIRLGGLDIPAGIAEADARSYDSVRLFIDRVHEYLSDFSTDDETLAAIIRICQLLNGLPLGIELAATWVQHFSCMEIAAAIQENLDFLVTKRRDRADRHQSLRAVFDYSWTLLSPIEQRMLAQMSVFSGAFSRPAALAVTQASLTDLIALVDKSLLQQLSVGRYTMHGLLRQFAEEKLHTLPPEPRSVERVAPESTNPTVDQQWVVYKRHANYYLSFVGEKAADLYGPKPQQALEELSVNMDNIRQACRWMLEHGEFELMNCHLAAISSAFGLQGLWDEAQALMASIIEELAGADNPANKTWPRLLPMALVEQARYMVFHLEYAAAIQSAEQAIERAQAVQDQDSEAGGYLFAGTSYRALCQNRRAKTLLEQGLAAIQSVPPYHAPTAGRGLTAVHGFLLSTIAAVCIKLGDDAEADQYATQTEQVFRTAGDLWGEGRALVDLSDAHYRAGHYTATKTYLERVIPIYQQVGSRSNESEAQDLLCRTLTNLGCFAEAQHHGQRALALGRELGDQIFECQSLRTLSRLSYEQADYEQAHLYSRAALHIAQSINNLTAEAFCQTSLGYALTEMNRHDEALAAQEAALRYWRDEDLEIQTIEAQNHMAFTLLAAGNLAEASAAVEIVLSYLKQNGLQRTISPLHISFTCYRVLRECQDRRAEDILQNAHGYLQKQATWIKEPDLRRSFLERVPEHRAIIREYEQIGATRDII